VVNFIVYILSSLCLLFSTSSQNIEKAFLQNNPKILYSQFSSKSHINISLPEPISFSDQLSNQQAYFLFKKIFNSFSTFEFYSERQSLSSEEETYILRARWSFKNKKNNNQYVFHIFFFLLKEHDQKHGNLWKITEIKAEKI